MNSRAPIANPAGANAAKFGVYIQVPFCQTKCTYCNFHTGVFASKLYAPYAGAVCREISAHAALYSAAGIAWSSGGFIVDTVYVGGGTPSLLDPEILACILRTVRSSFLCAFDEVTLEADPETVALEKAEAWFAGGFNRVSLGAQSFNDGELKSAGRMHRRKDAVTAVGRLRRAGFRNISLDLIAGLPGQTAASWKESLAAALDLRPEHLSIYLLEVDEGSRLGREVLSHGSRYAADTVPSDDEMAEFYERACETLSCAGYEHYEISNWALPGFASRHNLKYWQRRPYLGFGAGAHSFDGAERWANAHDPAAYVTAIEQGRLPIEQREQVTPQKALEEELFLGLRQLDGIDLAALEFQYNVPLKARFEKLQDAGLVTFEGSRVRLAPERLTVSNEVFVELLE